LKRIPSCPAFNFFVLHPKREPAQEKTWKKFSPDDIPNFIGGVPQTGRLQAFSSTMAGAFYLESTG
jgi:hypothetical protein